MTCPFAADARLAPEDLLAAASRAPPDGRAAFAASVAPRMAVWRTAAADRPESDETPINAGRLPNELNMAMAETDILAADGGFAGHWGGLLSDTKRAGRRGETGRFGPVNFLFAYIKHFVYVAMKGGRP